MLDATLIVKSDDGVHDYYAHGENEKELIEDLHEQLLAAKKLYTQYATQKRLQQINYEEELQGTYEGEDGGY